MDTVTDHFHFLYAIVSLVETFLNRTAYSPSWSGVSSAANAARSYGMRLEATPLDIARWTYDGRQDILSRVGIEREGTEILGGTLWVGPDGRRVAECPFIELRADGKYYCGIQDTKPEACTAHWCKKYIDPSN